MREATELTLDMLKVRTPDGDLVSVGEGNWGKVYADYLKNAGKRNIVWKRRQMGMTTFALARGFMAAAKNKNCVVVAKSIYEIAYLWRTIEGFIDNLSVSLPIRWMNKALHTFGLEGCSSSQFQIISSRMAVLPYGDGIDFLHFNEYAWWNEADQRRAKELMLPRLKPESEVIIECTPPDNHKGAFFDIWYGADAYGFTRHFFPWWKIKTLITEAVDEKLLTEKEKELMIMHGLTLE